MRNIINFSKRVLKEYLVLRVFSSSILSVRASEINNSFDLYRQWFFSINQEAILKLHHPIMPKLAHTQIFMTLGLSLMGEFKQDTKVILVHLSLS